jgi:GT2 family glycosyltransferase
MIVISYSKRHFDPSFPNKYLGSAGHIARQIYFAAIDAKGKENVLYVDAHDLDTWNLPQGLVDVLITIEENAFLAKKYFSPRRTLFIAVNHHPSSRRKICEIAFELGFPQAALDITDGILESGQGSSIADKILLVGDIDSVQSYLTNGVKLRNLYPVAYRPNHQDWLAPSKSQDIFCHIGSFGFRKGGDIILGLAKYLNSIGSSRCIHLTGLPVNRYWAEKLDEATSNYAANIKHHGWVEPDSKTFADLLNMCSVGIFPTREEGLSGAYLELALSGLPVVTTTKVGIETATEITMQKITLEELLRILKLEDPQQIEGFEKIGIAAKEFYNSLDLGQSQIYEAVARYLTSNRIWPSVNLVLAIHNKEKTLKKLFSLLSDAAGLVDNINLTVINDGSHDKSDRVINKFLKTRKASKVFLNHKFLTTPDIFEVKSNNLGMKQFRAQYQIILQDDNFILNKTLLAEMIAFADKFKSIGALGGMAGVNFYPIVNSCGDHLPGQHAVSKLEHYWRQDEKTDPILKESYFETDAVMRGPLLFSDQALEKIGLLDERYAPLYSDDMAWCFKARENNFRIMAIVGDVYNNSQTMTTSSDLQNKIYLDAYLKNTKLFYEECKPTGKNTYKKWVRTTWQVPTSSSTRIQFLFKLPFSLHRRNISNYVFLNYPQISRVLRAILALLRKLKSLFYVRKL